MEESVKNGTGESPTSTDSEKSAQQRESQALSSGVFMKRGKGMPFEEFVEVCVQQFKDKGLIKQPLPRDEDQSRPEEEYVRWQAQRPLMMQIIGSHARIFPHVWKIRHNALSKCGSVGMSAARLSVTFFLNPAGERIEIA
jgi:hypothetical protein